MLPAPAQSGFGLTGNFDLEMNTTSADQSFQVPTSILNLFSQADKTKLGLINSTTVTISAGPPNLDGTHGSPAPYLVVSGSGTLELKSVVSMVGNFRLAITPGTLDLTADVSTTVPVLGTITGTAAFQIDSSGLVGVATMSLGSSGSIPGVSVNASFFISINTTGGPRQLETYTVDTTNDATFGQVSATPSLQTVNDGVFIVAGGHIVLGTNGSSALTLEGQFTFGISSGSLTIGAIGRVDVGILGHLNVNGSLAVTSAGIVATLDISASAALPGSGFSFSGFFELEVNTTSSAQPIQRLNVDTNTGQVLFGTVADTLPAGTAQLLVGGSLQLADVSTSFGSFTISINGSFLLAVNANSLTVGINASFDVFGARLHIDKTATITAPGIVLDDTLGAHDFEIGGGLLSFNGNFELRINTTSQTALGVPPKTAELIVTGLDLGLFNHALDATGSITIGIVNGGFSINIPTSDPLSLNFFGLVTTSLSGYYNPGGDFQFTSKFDVSLGDSNFGATAHLSTTISNTGLTGTFSADGTLFGVQFVTFFGGLDVQSGGVSLTITVSVVLVPAVVIDGTTITPEADASFSHTFTLGQITQPVVPTLATQTGVLQLNLGADAAARGAPYDSDTSESYRVSNAGNGAVNVAALGFTQSYSNPGSIVVHNSGIGDDYIEIGQGVQAGANLTAGSGSDQLIYLGSGAATLNAGTGNDVLTGGAGVNTFNAGSGATVVHGGSGTNVINAGTGAALVSGGSGPNTVNWSAGDGALQFIGNGVANTLIVNDSNPGESVTVSQANGQTLLTVGSVTLTLANVQNITLNMTGGGAAIAVGDLIGSGVFHLTLALGSHAQPNAIVLQGSAGNDTFLLTGSSSTVNVAETGGPTFTLSSLAGDNLTIHGNQGNDTINASGIGQPLPNIHLNLYGDAGNDTITGSPGADVIHGGTGDDLLIGGGALTPFMARRATTRSPPATAPWRPTAAPAPTRSSSTIPPLVP